MKIGDQIKFSQKAINTWITSNQWYLSYNIQKETLPNITMVITDIQKDPFRDKALIMVEVINTQHKQRFTLWPEHLEYCDPAQQKKSKEQILLDKIKYLDNRFKNRNIKIYETYF